MPGVIGGILDFQRPLCVWKLASGTSDSPVLHGIKHHTITPSLFLVSSGKEGFVFEVGLFTALLREALTSDVLTAAWHIRTFLQQLQTR
jgi:hypothetical protein